MEEHSHKLTFGTDLSKEDSFIEHDAPVCNIVRRHKRSLSDSENLLHQSRQSVEERRSPAVNLGRRATDIIEAVADAFRIGLLLFSVAGT
jgi:hypothetical protein